MLLHTCVPLATSARQKPTFLRQTDLQLQCLVDLHLLLQVQLLLQRLLLILCRAMRPDQWVVQVSTTA
jgi:hypothetical protein